MNRLLDHIDKQVVSTSSFKSNRSQAVFARAANIAVGSWE